VCLCVWKSAVITNYKEFPVPFRFRKYPVIFYCDAPTSLLPIGFRVKIIRRILFRSIRNYFLDAGPFFPDYIRLVHYILYCCVHGHEGYVQEHVFRITSLPVTLGNNCAKITAGDGDAIPLDTPRRQRWKRSLFNGKPGRDEKSWFSWLGMSGGLSYPCIKSITHNAQNYSTRVSVCVCACTRTHYM